jgi:endonuclease/exonuclease/phosphatase family metal-dependent hydrolase
MIPVSICTFNIENLYMRYKIFDYRTGDRFKRKILSAKELREKGGFLPSYEMKNSFRIYDKDSWRMLTARAIKGYGDFTGRGRGGGAHNKKLPDILCLVEVDSMDAIRLFNEKYLASYYDYAILIDGNDPRRIDVGLLSKYKIKSISTNIYEPYDKIEGSSTTTNTTNTTKPSKRKYLFSRDCLIVEIEIPGADKILTLFLNHLKSKLVFENKDAAKRVKEEKEANELREAQAKKVAEFVRKRFSGDLFDKEDFVVLGDFNDTPDSPYLKKLVKELGMVDVISSSFARKEDKWTYYWDGENAVTQIDYILLSPHLAKNSTKLPYIERRGISNARKTSHLDTNNGEKIPFNFKRFPQVSNKIEASDHCPVFLELMVG